MYVFMYVCIIIFKVNRAVVVNNLKVTRFKDWNNSCSFPVDWETTNTEREIDNIYNSFHKATRFAENFYSFDR